MIAFPAVRALRYSIAIAAVLAAMVLVVLDAAIVNVALPAMARALQATPSASVWIVTAYQLALVMALLPCAALGESLGYRRVFTAGVAVFTAASALCALSPSLPWLLAARFLQGLGGAAVMALGVALLRFTVTQQRAGAAIGWNATAVALASAAGPTIGAAILSAAGWPWLFAINLPFGALVLLATRALPLVPATQRGLDLVSVLLNAGVFAGLVLGAEIAPARPVVAAATFAAAAFALVLLIRRELPKTYPLIPFDLLRIGPFRVSAVASIFCFSGQAAALVALPFHLQQAFGQGVLTAGLYMTPWPLTVALAAPLVNRLADRVSARRLCALGGACLAAGLTAMAVWPSRAGPQPLIFCAILCGLGFSLFNLPNNRSLFLSAPRARGGAAGALQGSARLTGQTTGAVIMAILFATVSTASAPRLGLVIGAALTLAAGITSTLRSGRPAAAV